MPACDLPIVTITRRLEFSAAHRYHRADWTPARNREVFGACNSPSGHGHDYVCRVSLRGPIDPVTGMVINLTVLDQAMKELVETELDGRFLDREHPHFTTRIPTLETISSYLFDRLSPGIRPGRLHRVRLQENSRLHVEACGEEPHMRLTRSYEISTAHRLHAGGLSDEDNRKLFGKCNNLHGHGHNYRIEVTVGGTVDAETGMVVNIAELDNIVDEEIYARFDHKHLNLDTTEFRTVNPTSENFVRVIWNLLQPRIRPAALYRVRLHETSKNYFDYYGETGDSPTVVDD